MKKDRIYEPIRRKYRRMDQVRWDEMLRMDGKIQEFRNRVMRGDKEALAQIENVMKV